MNYLELANKVLQEMNEPEISSASGIASARGIQKQVLSAVNKSYRMLVNEDREWPFNFQEGTFPTVSGTDLYDRPTDTKVIDWDSFYITTTGSDDVSPRRLRFIDRTSYRRYYKRDDLLNEEGLRGFPKYVYKDKSGKIGLTPIADDVYQIVFQYWTIPSTLIVSEDTPLVPEHYQWVIVEGALMYSYRMRSDLENSSRAQREYDTGVKLMREELIGTKQDMTPHRTVPTATKYNRWSY